MYPYASSFLWHLSPSDVEGTLSRVPLSYPCDEVPAPPFLWICLDGHPFWPLACLQLRLFTWARAVPHKESQFGSGLVARSSCLLKPAEAKRRNLFLGCWDVLWTLRAGSAAGLEPRIGKSEAGLCVLSLWGCSCLLSLASTDQLSATACTQGGNRPPQPNSSHSSV